MRSSWKFGLAGLALSTPALSTPALSTAALAQSPEWSTDFAPRGVLGTVQDLAVHDDGGGAALYVCGRLTATGDVIGDAIGKWDGAAWRPVPSTVDFLGGANANVAVIESFDSGAGAELYAGGSFLSIEGVSATSIAKWNGSTWSTVGSPELTLGGAASVTMMRAVDDGTGPALYVGVYWPPALPAAASLHKWDGSQWSEVGPSLSGLIMDLTVFDFGAGPQLVVAGKSLQYGGPGVASVATWNGSSWTRLGPDNAALVRSVTTFDDGSGSTLFAGSDALGALGLVSKWSGAGWQSVSSGASNGRVFDLHAFDEGAGMRLFAAGLFTTIDGTPASSIARFDGSTWSPLGVDGVRQHASNTPTVARLTSFDLGGGPKLCLGGSFDEANGVSAFNLTAWNGMEFEAFGQGHGLLGSVLSFAVLRGELHVGGVIDAVSGALQAGVARWSGARWSSSAPIEGGDVTSLCAFDDGQGEQLFIAGSFSGPAQTYFAWDGANASTPGGIGSAFVDIRAQVSRVGPSGPELFVAGKFDAIAGVAATNVARWDGTSWTEVGPQPPNNFVRALAFHDDGHGGGEQLYAAGTFLTAGGQTVHGIARHNGSIWSPVGNGFSASVSALAVFDDGAGPKLYAGGGFGAAPPIQAAGVARWDGVRWNPVGDGLSNGEVLTFAVFDDGGGSALYAGGGFAFSGANPIRRLARWNGSMWEEVGGGVGGGAGVVRALAALDDGSGFGESLWVGGSFLEAGGIVSAGIARWGKVCGADKYCSSGVTSSNCISVLDGIGRASASHASSFTLAATQLEGGRSGQIFYGVNGAIASPWGQSTHFLCVNSPLQRTASQSTNGTASACDGALSLDWNAYSTHHPAALGQPFAAGQDVWAQAYFRDPAGPKTTALTNGLHFVICP